MDRDVQIVSVEALCKSCQMISALSFSSRLQQHPLWCSQLSGAYHHFPSWPELLKHAKLDAVRVPAEIPHLTFISVTFVVTCRMAAHADENRLDRRKGRCVKAVSAQIIRSERYGSLVIRIMRSVRSLISQLERPLA